MAGLTLPLLLMKQGGVSLWLGCLLFGTEAILAVVVGRRLLRLLRAKTTWPESLLGVPLLLTFFAIYIGGNLLVLWMAVLFLPPGRVP